MSNRTVLAMLREAAEKFPDRMYAYEKTDEGWKGRTYPEIREDARSLAASLIRLGVHDGATAALIAEGSPEWIVSEFGTIAAGGICVPLSIRLLPEEIPFRLNHSGAQAIFISGNQLPKLLSVLDEVENRRMKIICIDEDEENIGKIAAGSGLAAGERLFSLASLIDEGRQLDAEHRRVNEIEESADEEDVVTISYTSGTTGNPKGIMLMNRNYYVNCKESVETFEVPYDYQTLLVLPCDHSFAHTVGIYASLLRGITLYFVDSRGGSMGMLRNIPRNLLEAEPVFLLSVPALTGNFMKKITAAIAERGGVVEKLFTMGMNAGIMYNGNVYAKPFLLKRMWYYLPWKIADLLVFRTIRKQVFGKKFQFFVGGGALLEKSQQEFFQALGAPVHQGYGLTEAAPVISSNTRKYQKLGSSGKPFASVECRILDENGREVPKGEKGEIAVRGENVMKGYFRNDDATREAIRDGWLHTGDLGFIDGDGFLNVTGRAKALLISADGEKYSPEEIEEALVNSSPYIRQAIVWNDHRKYTSALLVPDAEAVKRFLAKTPGAGQEAVLDLFRDILQTFRTDRLLKNRFPAAWVPAVFQLVAEPFSDRNLLMNSTGKLVRYKIVETYGDLLEYMYTEEGREPYNEKNRAVCGTLFSPGEKDAMPAS